MAKRAKKKEYTYVVRKLVKARSAPEAIRLSAKVKVHDVYVDAAIKKEEDEVKAEAIGFHVDTETEEDEEEEYAK